MRSIGQALMWETFARSWGLGGFFLLGNLIPLFVYFALCRFPIDPVEPSFVLMHIAFILIMAFQYAIGIAGAQGSFSRLYAAPITTPSLVAWHLFPGGVILALEVAFASWIFNSLFHLQWPIWGPALFTMVAWSFLQLLVSVSQRSVLGLFITLAPLVLSLVWFRTRYGDWSIARIHFWNELTPGEIATMLGAILFAYVATTAAVARDRCGEPMPWSVRWEWLARLWDGSNGNLQTTLPPFRSPVHAQFWYEWKIKGVLLPFLFVVATTFTFLAWMFERYASGTHRFDVADLHKGLLVLGGLMSLGAGIIGQIFGVSVQSSSARQRTTSMRDAADSLTIQEGMGHFQGTRPLSDRDFAKSIWLTGGLSLLIAWLLWGVLFLAVMLLGAVNRQSIESAIPNDFTQWYMPLCLLGSWVAMMTTATIGLTGRGAKILLVLIVGWIAFALLAGMQADTRWIREKWYLDQVFFWAVCIACVIATLWAFRESLRLGLMKPIHQGSCAIVALAIVCAAIATNPSPFPAVTYPWIITFAAFVVAPFATMPLAIHWNRHR